MVVRPDLQVADLSPFVPVRLAARLAAAEGDLPARVEGEAAVVFSDIAGFSRLAEALCADDRGEGAERLTEVLSEQFGGWLARVEVRGGEVVKFAGDALLALWWADEHGGIGRAVRAAAACALDMRESLRERPRIEGVPLSLRVAVGAGGFVAARIGGVGGRFELVAGGPAMAQLGPTLGEAPVGGACASPEAWGHLSAYATGERRGTAWELKEIHAEVAGTEGGDIPASGPGTPGGAVAAGGVALSGSTSGDLGPRLRELLPDTVRAHLDSGLGEFLSERRMVTVAFVRLDDLRAGDPRWLLRLDGAVRSLQEVLRPGGGALDKVSVDDKGVTVVATFGLASTEVEYRPAEAVRAAVRAHRRLLDEGVPCSVGMASGKVFAGPVGPPSRREYTVIGDVVNLAARLAGSAAGAVVVDEDTRRLGAVGVRFEAAGPLVMKGLGQEIARFRPVEDPLEESPGRASDRLRLVGRDREVAAVLAALEVPSGRGRLVLVEGEAGIGKTRLVNEVLSRLNRQGVQAFVGQARAALRDVPHAPWIDVLPAALGLPAGPASARAAALEGRLAGEPERRAHLPLLGPLLGVALPDTAATASLVGAPRGEALRAALTALLVERAAVHPSVLVIEDAQWLDPASIELVEEIARAELPLRMVLTLRPGEAGDDASVRLLRLPSAVRVPVGELDRSALLGLVEAELRAASVAADLADWLVERTRGNPFFCLELVVALQHAGVLRVHTGRAEVDGGRDALAALEVPPTVEGLVRGRLDRLAPLQQLALKTLSVVGTWAGLGLVVAATPGAPDPAAVGDALAGACLAGLLVRAPDEAEPTFTFRHGLVREVAYQSMVAAPRRAIHRAVAEWLERGSGGADDRVLPLLAHHFSGARDLPRTVLYLERAGDHAHRSGAIEEAARSFEKALDLLARYPGEVQALTTPIQRVRWIRKLARSRTWQGRHREAVGLVQDGLHRLGLRVPEGEAAWGLRLVGQLVRQAAHRYVPSLVLRPRPRDERLMEAAELLRVLIELAFWEFPSPLVFPALAIWTLNVSERAGDAIPRSYVMNVGLFLGGLRLEGAARRYFQRGRSLPAGDYLDSYHGAVSEAIHLGMHARWAQAEPCLDAMRAAVADVGNDYLTARSDQTRGLFRLLQGRITEALPLLGAPAAIAVRLGQTRDEFNVWVLSALALLEAGRLDEAVPLVNRAREVFAAGAVPPDAPLFHAALSAVLADRREDPEGVLDAGERLVEAVGRRPPFNINSTLLYPPVMEALLGLVERRRGDEGRARAALVRLSKVLDGQAGAFPFATAVSWLMRGRVAASAGRTAAAAGWLRRALRRAQDDEMFIDEVRARSALARLASVSPAESADHQARAAALIRAHGLTARLTALPAPPGPMLLPSSSPGRSP